MSLAETGEWFGTDSDSIIYRGSGDQQEEKIVVERLKCVQISYDGRFIYGINDENNVYYWRRCCTTIYHECYF